MKFINQITKVISVLLIISSRVAYSKLFADMSVPSDVKCTQSIVESIKKGNPFDGCKELSESNANSFIAEEDLTKSYFENQKYHGYIANGCLENYKVWYDQETPSGATNPLTTNLKSYIDYCEYRDRRLQEIKSNLFRSTIAACVNAFIKVTPPQFCWSRNYKPQNRCGYMKTCGPLACASSVGMCASNVLLMTYKTGKFIWDFAANISSGGFYKTFKDTLKGYIGDNLVKDYGIPFAIYVAQKELETFLSKEGNQRIFKQKMLVEARKFDQSANEKIVDMVFNILKPKPMSDEQKAKTFFQSVKEYFLNASFETTGLVSLYKDCKINSNDGVLNCVKAVLGIVGTLDPSGVINLVNAFIYPLCPNDLATKRMKKKLF